MNCYTIDRPSDYYRNCWAHRLSKSLKHTLWSPVTTSWILKVTSSSMTEFLDKGQRWWLRFMCIYDNDGHQAIMLLWRCDWDGKSLFKFHTYGSPNCIEEILIPRLWRGEQYYKFQVQASILKHLKQINTMPQPTVYINTSPAVNASLAPEKCLFKYFSGTGEMYINTSPAFFDAG